MDRVPNKQFLEGPFILLSLPHSTIQGFLHFLFLISQYLKNPFQAR